MAKTDFNNVWHILSTGVPPEISHFRNQTHPGRQFWLKTVIPSRDIDHHLFDLWARVIQQHSLSVQITDQAYDWFENIIPGAHSIWVREGIDVVLRQHARGADYSILPFEDSFNSSGLLYHRQVLQSQRLDCEKSLNSDWQNLISTTQLMSSWTTDTQARARRKVFKVVKNEENSSPNDQ